MSLKTRRAREWLAKRSRQRWRDYPLATVVYYGPTDNRATKLVAAIIAFDGAEAEPLERWTVEAGDIRQDDRVAIELVDWLKACGAKQVVIADRILGCPHEEGIDYPEGQTCPQCPFWADRDRFTGERIADSGDSNDDSGQEAGDPDTVALAYSPLCQIVEQDGVSLQVQIYRGGEPGWSLEVVNEQGTSFVWDDLFDTDGEAWAEFERTLREEGLSAFRERIG